jgi:hypothetical protein
MEPSLVKAELGAAKWIETVWVGLIHFQNHLNFHRNSIREGLHSHGRAGMFPFFPEYLNQ